VVEAVRFARQRCLLVSVRGGGDGVGGFAVCDEGLVIDLSPLKRISVVPAAPAAAPDPPHAPTFYPTSTTEQNRVCIVYATQRQRRSNDTEAW
jgi:FAD binding domain